MSLPLGEIRLRDVRLTVGDKLCVTAEFGADKRPRPAATSNSTTQAGCLCLLPAPMLIKIGFDIEFKLLARRRWC